MYIGSPRPWPPEPADEVAGCLDRVASRFGGEARWLPEQLTLYESLLEMRQWLVEPRTFTGHHNRSWDSVTDDVVQAARRRGDHLAQATTGLSSVLDAMQDPQIRRDRPRRTQVAAEIDQILRSMGSPSGLEAAFNDLLAAVAAPAKPSSVVIDHRDLLAGCFAAGGRNLHHEARTLSGVLRDSATDVAVVKHMLDGVQIDRSGRRKSAGLSWEEGLVLCRRLLHHDPATGAHAVWLLYADARVRWTHWLVEVGSVTFYDGSALVGLLEQVEAGGDFPAGFDVPEELVGAEAPFRIRANEFPDDIEAFAAVRVDLTGRHFTDPVNTATDIADALVDLASFRQGGSTWQRMDGYIHVIDGSAVGLGGWRDPRGDAWVDADHTDAELAGMADELPRSLVNDGSRLRRLAALASNIRPSAGQPGLTSIILGIRAIEVLAAEEDRGGWVELLNDTFAVSWTRCLIAETIVRAVERVASSGELRYQGGITGLDEIKARIMRHDSTRPNGVIIDRRAAFEALHELADVLPNHHMAARHLRTVHARVQSVEALSEWIEELMTEYTRTVAQARRIRNSLAHGGPVCDETAMVVAPFVNRQARRVVNTALWAAVEGQDVAACFAQVRSAGEVWRASIPRQSSVVDALWDSRTTGHPA